MKKIITMVLVLGFIVSSAVTYGQVCRNILHVIGPIWPDIEGCEAFATMLDPVCEKGCTDPNPSRQTVECEAQSDGTYRAVMTINAGPPSKPDPL